MDNLVFPNVEVTASSDTTPVAGRKYIGGIDWARGEDATAIVIIDATTKQVVALERYEGIGWSRQRSRIEAVCNLWKPAVVWAEENSIGIVTVEALQASGLPIRPFRMTRQNKPLLIDTLAHGIENGDLALMPDAVLLEQFSRYTREQAPERADDTVIATALAWYGVKNGGVKIDFA